MEADKPWNAGLASAYDEVAEAYAKAFAGELGRKPVDRALLERFAAPLPAGSPVADVGSGPGQVARFLKGCGLEPLGLSPETVVRARQRHPDLRFAVGDMRKLEFPAEIFAGIAAFYAVIHLERAGVGKTFREFYRVLKPEGSLLLSFHLGEGETHLEAWFGKPVSLSLTFFRPAEMAA